MGIETDQAFASRPGRVLLILAERFSPIIKVFGA